MFHDTYFCFKQILQIFLSYRGALDDLSISCPEMGDIQIIKENCKELSCFKFKLRFLEIISKMNQLINLTFQEQFFCAKWDRPVLGMCLMGTCES